MEKMKLFCFPYVGGSAMIYTKWKRYLNRSIELCPVEMAGRGKRFTTPLYTNFDEALDDAYSLILKDIDDSDYALFGHSLGSLMVFELAHRIIEQNLKQPVCIFFSGRYPPHITKEDDSIKYSELPDDELREKLLELGGIDEEFFKDEELLEIFMPIIKADYKIVETYGYLPKNTRFNQDIVVLTGKDDKKVTYEDMTEWKNYTNKECSVIEFEGDHFFINEKIEEVVEIINKTMLNNKVTVLI